MTSTLFRSRVYLYRMGPALSSSSFVAHFVFLLSAEPLLYVIVLNPYNSSGN